MKRAATVGGAIAVVVVLLAFTVGYRVLKQFYDPTEATPSTIAATPGEPVLDAEAEEALAAANPGFIYGRVTTQGGSTYEGRLRWGRGEEAFWGDYFNGTKKENHWASDVPAERLPVQRSPFRAFGVELFVRESPIDLSRPFMARFGDIARIEAQGVFDVGVTLKTGTAFVLDRTEAGDFDDGVRVWEGGGQYVDLQSGQIQTIELLPTARLSAAPKRLFGTVHTQQGDFSGSLQWNREKSLGSDLLEGHTADGDVALHFDTIGSVARVPPYSSQVTLADGREMVLSGSREAGRGNLGVYVDDPRYGRVLVTWRAFERVDFSPGGSSPAYDDFPPGSPLSGTVTTRSGRRLTGRLVYDLDESETTETLDAPSQGVEYTLPFGLIVSIALPGADETDARHARVTLRSGEELELELSGDLGRGNAGLLVFADGEQSPEYVLWSDVQEVEFDRPLVNYPPFGGG